MWCVFFRLRGISDHRFCAPGLLAAVLLGGTATAASAQPAPDLRQAFEAAWTRAVQAAPAGNRRSELDARSQAAAQWLAAPPSVGVAHRTDRAGTNGGLRELELELSAPIQSGPVRRAMMADAEAGRAVFDAQQDAARLRLAGELRELAAQAALARVELRSAVARTTETHTVLDHARRRVQAGDAPRVELLQAQATLAQAQTVELQARSQLETVRRQWTVLTGLAEVASLNEPVGTPVRQPHAHPLVAQARAALGAAQARLALAQADVRDPVELGASLARERPAFGAAVEQSMRLAIKVPLGNHARNAPRHAAALAEVDTAQAELQSAERQALQEVAAAEQALLLARSTQTLAAQRAQASTEVDALFDRSYRLGESDLAARLRAQSERYEAELALARAQVQTQRAISQVNQSLGLLP